MCDTVLEISALNSGWGICGFTASLGALYQANSKMKARIKGAVASKDAAGDTDLVTRLLAEIKTYLVILEAEGKTTLRNEIESFTKTFKTKKKDYSNFTIKDYLARVNQVPAFLKNKTLKDLKSEDFSIALPPNAVVDYLRRICGLNAILVTDNRERSSSVILGFGTGEKKGPQAKWNGLRHWVYRHSENVIYNWGKIVSRKKLSKQMSKYRLVCQISV